MSVWDILGYIAWAIAAAMAIWMVTDAIRVQREYSEDFLMSSREGADELLETGEKR